MVSKRIEISMLALALKQTDLVGAVVSALACVIGVFMSHAAIAAWEPKKPVELIVPAGVGSDLDQKARLIQDIIAKHNLMRQPLSLAYKPGGAGAEGFLNVKKSQGDSHQLLIVDNQIFTVPLASGVPFNWRDTTPVAMLALEQFILWTNAKSGYRSAKEYMEAAKAAGPGRFKMGGVGSGFPDQILTLALGWETENIFSYLPYKDGSLLDQLVANNIDATVSNPSEALVHWRAGVLTAQCVFDDVRMPYTGKVTATQSWGDIPTCEDAGIPVVYQMLYGIFMAPGVGTEQVDYFVELFRKVTATPEWRSHMELGAFKQTFRTGPVFTNWLVQTERFHRFHGERRASNWVMAPIRRKSQSPSFPR